MNFAQHMYCTYISVNYSMNEFPHHLTSYKFSVVVSMANFLLCDSWGFCMFNFIVIEYFRILSLLFHISILSLHVIFYPNVQLRHTIPLYC